MIEACRQNNEIIFLNSDSYPTVFTIPNVKETLAIKYVADFFIFVQMLNEEYFDFVFVGRSHACRWDSNLVSILVGALGCNGIDSRNRRTITIDHPQVG